MTTSDDAAAVAWLKAQIESLSSQAPMWSRTAYTHRGTTHLQFSNGVQREEGGERGPWKGSVRDMCEATLNAVREYRATIQGPAVLIWRCEPEYTDTVGDGSIYTRLCFEPDPRETQP